MSAQEAQGVTETLIRRLEEAIDSLPKEGYKASVAVGAVSSALGLVEAVTELTRLAECIGVSKGTCRGGEERFCDPQCARVYLERVAGKYVVHKARSNAFSAELSPGEVIVKTKGVRFTVTPSEIRVAIQGVEGYVEESVPVTDHEALYDKSYTIKYVLKRVAKPVRVAIADLRACAARNAIVC